MEQLTAGTIVENGKHNQVIDMLAMKACINTKNLQNGKRIYQKYNTENENIKLIQFHNVLIDFYGHFGDAKTAQLIYENIKENEKNTATISAMMKCFVNNKQYKNALKLYDFVLSNVNNCNLKVNDIIHTLAIKACGFLKDFQKGKEIIQRNIDHENLNNKKTSKMKDALIEFYFQCGDISNAKLIFDALYNRNIRSFNVMIEGFVPVQQYQQALFYYICTAIFCNLNWMIMRVTMTMKMISQQLDNVGYF